jgi:hypothetical protein
MSTTIQSTQLDFAAIKNKLKTFLAQQPEFADYNFEGAGLSNILDVLAWNTHFNGLVANFALNESFLSTSQLRSSVVGHADALGYVPRSRAAALGVVALSIVNTAPNRSPFVTLPAFTTFAGAVDGVAYQFQTIEPHTAFDNGVGVYNFLNTLGEAEVVIKEGRQTSKTFYVGEAGERTVYVIPDTNVDINTIEVRVYDSPSSTTFTSYTNLRQAVQVTLDSTLYDLAEAPNGYWELHFSDGFSTGRSPVTGNKIVVTYLSVAGEEANGVTLFTPSNSITMDNTQFNLQVNVVAASSGGSEKESIESIKQNAPIAFASQQRLVTALDYRAQILSTFNTIRDCIAWGGEDNIPAQYGKVFVSLKFQDGLTPTIQQATKDTIVSQLSNNLAIMSIDTVFVDPVVIYLGCQTTFNYNPNRSSTSLGIAESLVTRTIINYFNNNLQVFGGAFRRSNLLTEIDQISDAILDTRMDITAQLRFTPVLGLSGSYTVDFPFSIASPNGLNPTITSNTFLYGSTACIICNALNSTKLQVVSSTGEIIVDNVGSYTPTTGSISLIGFAPTNIQGDTVLKINASPQNQGTVKTARNYLLQLDLGTSFAFGVLDFENSQTGS